MKGKRFIWEILLVLSFFMYAGAIGGIETSESVPLGSAVILVLSLAYIIGFVMVTCVNSAYTDEDFDEMQKDLDSWCFGKGDKNESGQRRKARKRTQKGVSRSKSGR